MTIALDVGPLKPNPAGVGVYVRSLAVGLVEIGRQDVVYVGRRRDAEGLPGAVPSTWRASGLPYPVWVELLGRRDVGRSGAAVAHFTDGLVPPTKRRPTIVTVLDMSLVRLWRSHRVVRYARIPLVLAGPRLADRVIAISRATADEVIRLTGTSARRIDVVPLAARASARPVAAATVAAACRRLGLPDGPHLLVPGTIEPRKNHLRVLAAFEDLVGRRAIPDDMSLVIAGQAGWKSARTLAAIRSSPVRARIKALGYVSEDDMAALMTGAAAVVYASTYEGFGLPVLEALACGAPVVTSIVSSMPEVAGEAAVLVDPLDAAAIGRGILDALRADAATRERGILHAGRFTWAATASATAAVYDAAAR